MSDSLVVLIMNIAGVCGSAAFAGVMLSVGITLGGYWKSLESSEFLDWFSRNNAFVARSVPVVVAPTLLALVVSTWSAWGEDPFALWLASLLSVVAVLVATGAYFVPTNRAFADGTLDVEDVGPKLVQWTSIHWIRIGLALTAAILACLALAD